MIFLGTPHRGTGKALHSQGAIYDAIVKAQYETQTDILKTLEAGNETLVDVVDEFTRLINLKSSKMDVFCFYEQKSTSVGRIVNRDDIKEFVVDERSGVLDGHKSRGLPRDHFNLNKFTGEEDGCYKAVSREIQRMAKIRTFRGEVPAERIPLKQPLLDKLRLVDQAKKRKDEAEKRPKGELYPRGTWLVDDKDQFANWMTSPNSFLWLHGAVGAGKTLLSHVGDYMSENVISHLEQHSSASAGRTAVAYFFIQDEDTETFDRDVLVKSLLAQLYEAMYLETAARELEDKMDQLDGNAIAEEILKNFISTCSGGAYIVIDGLDECPCSWSGTAEATRRKRQAGPRLSICDLLATLRKWDLQNLHLFLSSRPESDITAFVETQGFLSPAVVETINLEDDRHRTDVDRDIGSLIDATIKEPRLKGSCLEDPKLARKFRRKLVRRADGVIFYAHLQLLLITETPPLGKDDLDELLETLPVDLYDTYERALRRIKEMHIKFVRRLLVWQLLTTLSIPIAEAGEIMRIPLEDAETYNDNSKSMSLPPLKGGLSNPKAVVGLLPGILQISLVRNYLCTWKSRNIDDTSGFTEVIGIRHSSFREYLTSEEIRKSEHQTVRDFFVDKTGMRASIAVLCLRYFFGAASWLIKRLIKRKIALEDHHKKTLKKFPLVEYAIVNGLNLTEKIGPENWPRLLERLIKEIFRPWSQFDIFGLLLKGRGRFIWGLDTIVPFGPLTHFVGESLLRTLDFILKTSQQTPEDINVELCHACVHNLAGAAELLLRYGADVFAPWKASIVPGTGYRCVVDMIMVGDSWSALAVLAKSHKDVLSHCESLGHDHLRRALRRDYQGWSDGCVVNLLRLGADPNHRNNDADAPLVYEPILRWSHWALEDLLSHSTVDVDIDARDDCFGNALQCAVAIGNYAAVSKLLLAGAAMDDPTNPAWSELLAQLASGASINLEWYNFNTFPDGEVAAARLRSFQERFGERSQKRDRKDIQFAQEAQEYVWEQFIPYLRRLRA